MTDPVVSHPGAKPCVSEHGDEMRDKARLERALRDLRTLMRRHGGASFLPLARKLMEAINAIEAEERELLEFLASDRVRRKG